MTDTRFFTPAEWEQIDGVRILDPDGWRHDGKSFDEPISWHEWITRMSVSTIESTRPIDREKFMMRYNND